jgi:hypothetical protein
MLCIYFQNLCTTSNVFIKFWFLIYVLDDILELGYLVILLDVMNDLSFSVMFD